MTLHDLLEDRDAFARDLHGDSGGTQGRMRPALDLRQERHNSIALPTGALRRHDEKGLVHEEPSRPAGPMMEESASASASPTRRFPSTLRCPSRLMKR